MLTVKETKGLYIIVFVICSGYSINASFSSTMFYRKLEFNNTGFTVDDVIQTDDVGTIGCMSLCLQTASCASALSVVNSCTLLNKRLCTGPLQNDDKNYYMKDDGYIFAETFGLFYKVVYDPLLSQPNAKVFCQTECGSLLRIDTAEKQQYVEDHMALEEYSGHNTFYIDAEKNGSTWVWSDGTAITTFFWADNQPNYGPAKGIRLNRSKDSKWDDGAGTSKRAYICQRSFK